MRIISFVFLSVLFLSNSFGQKIEKVYLNKGDTTSNRYLVVSPIKSSLTGFMFLIPSFYETPENVLVQTDLPILAAEQGILTIIPTFKTGLDSFGIDSLTQQSFKELLFDANKRFKLNGLKFYVGGFSIGGSCAVKFAEEAFRDNFAFKPNALFVVDAPLDFEQFYKSNKRILRIAPNSKISKEAPYLIGRVEEIMKGTPENAIEKYRYYSPYSFSDTNQSAIKHIKNLPIRYYTEPEINWLMEELNFDYSSLNALDGSGMINELKLLGNNNSRLVITHDKGYRKPVNRKQPHSWSIVEPMGILNWLKSLK